jgi:hypothetical protein
MSFSDVPWSLRLVSLVSTPREFATVHPLFQDSPDRSYQTVAIIGRDSMPLTFSPVKDLEYVGKVHFKHSWTTAKSHQVVQARQGAQKIHVRQLRAWEPQALQPSQRGQRILIRQPCPSEVLRNSNQLQLCTIS